MKQLPNADTSEPPVPPEEVKIRKVITETYQDRRRLKISLELTPFQASPDIEVLVTDGEHKAVASTSIIAAVENNLVFTMHLPEQTPSTDCLLNVEVLYSELGKVDEIEQRFSISNTTGLEEA